jgi:hypothetical protein
LEGVLFEAKEERKGWEVLKECVSEEPFRFTQASHLANLKEEVCPLKQCNPNIVCSCHFPG